MLADRARGRARAPRLPVRRARRRPHPGAAAPRRPAELGGGSQAGELGPDFGPASLHPTAGAVLVAARPPLVAFNVELAPPATVEDARAIAARIREGGDEGLPGVRALGLWLAQRGVAQVSTNVEDHRATPLARGGGGGRPARPVGRRRARGARAPQAAFEGFPDGRPAPRVRHDRADADSSGRTA